MEQLTKLTLTVYLHVQVWFYGTAAGIRLAEESMLCMV